MWRRLLNPPKVSSRDLPFLVPGFFAKITKTRNETKRVEILHGGEFEGEFPFHTFIEVIQVKGEISFGVEFHLIASN